MARPKLTLIEQKSLQLLIEYYRDTMRGCRSKRLDETLSEIDRKLKEGIENDERKAKLRAKRPRGN